MLVKNSQLEVSWKRTNTKILAEGIPSHSQLYHKILNTIIEEPKQMPDWLTTGITYQLPKSGDTKEPKNYRPITRLSTAYKTLTGKIARRISVHVEEHNLLPAEQKECHSGSKGCKDQLLISKTILEDCKNRRKNLNMAWIDYERHLMVLHIAG
jgi:hypothetical protein